LFAQFDGKGLGQCDGKRTDLISVKVVGFGDDGFHKDTVMVRKHASDGPLGLDPTDAQFDLGGRWR
jgi:hypothetical protein